MYAYVSGFGCTGGMCWVVQGLSNSVTSSGDMGYSGTSRSAAIW